MQLGPLGGGYGGGCRDMLMPGGRVPKSSPTASASTPRSTNPITPAVWWGAGAGIGLSVLFGAIFAGVYYAAKTLLFQGTAKAIFQVGGGQGGWGAPPGSDY